MLTSLWHAVKTRLVPVQEKPILLLSYPRSGSSWIGTVLGSSPDLVYLREPVNQALAQKHGYHALIYPQQDARTLRYYKRYADLAFRGMPPPGVDDVVQQKEKVGLFARRDKNLLIKEVNPLAVEFFLERYDPHLILLFRHPAAIGDSFHRLGWLDQAWERFGRSFGERMHAALEASAGIERSLIFFEEFAHQPRKQFFNLFHHLGLTPPGDLDHVIDQYSYARKMVLSPYENTRWSRDEIGKWRQNLPGDAIQAIRKGYLQSRLPYYRREGDWW